MTHGPADDVPCRQKMQRMKRHLDVLVVESDLGAADDAAAALEAVGHHVHRCYEVADPGLTCRAVRDPGACPLDSGIDVALLVRGTTDPLPTGREIGVSCAVRAHVPVAAQGPALDAYEPFLTRRIDGDVADEVVVAADLGDKALREDILDRVRMVLPCASVDTVDCELERVGHRLVVHLLGPRIGNRAEKAAAVRVLDAVWASGRTYGHVDVSYHARSDVTSP